MEPAKLEPPMWVTPSLSRFLCYCLHHRSVYRRRLPVSPTLESICPSNSSSLLVSPIPAPSIFLFSPHLPSTSWLSVCCLNTIHLHRAEYGSICRPDVVCWRIFESPTAR